MNEGIRITNQLCPICGCHVGSDPYEKDKVLYCCQSCATGGQCECGCCDVVENEKKVESN